MSNPQHDDIILWLLPHKGPGFHGAVEVTELPENKSRFIPARQSRPCQGNIDQDDPERTVAQVQDGLDENIPHLAVRYSQGGKTPAGVVCGTDADVELTIKASGVSRKHFAITFDGLYRPVIKDLQSQNGTMITYNGETGARLSDFTWSLEGPSILNGKPPVLHITDKIQFQILLPHCDYSSPQHIDRVTKFRMGSANPETLVASFHIDPSGVTKVDKVDKKSRKELESIQPGSGPRVLYRQRIGQGGFGFVYYVWNANTREQYATKEPKEPEKMTPQDLGSWKQEADIMARDHIVKFRGASFSPYPQLSFEYVSGGSLERYSDFSALECTQVLCQLSSAIQYLHSLNPPLVHRDIKPENVLVQSREPGSIYVKFADFGLAKAAEVMQSACGTFPWLAPEALRVWCGAAGRDDTYSPLVDIFSLGLVIAHLACKGSDSSSQSLTTIAGRHHLLHRVKLLSDDEDIGPLLRLILKGMLVEDPRQRWSADKVNSEAQKMLQAMINKSENEGAATPTLSVFGAHSTAEPKNLDDNYKSAGVVDAEEGNSSFVARDSVGDEGSQQTIKASGQAQSTRKRKLSEESVASPPSGSLTCPPSGDQQDVIDATPRRMKRAKTSKH
ncbi:serine/threonine-protein kinase Chk2 [Fonsecaea erecta]|uniref:non-specific serine/threonine protein kinase n=1 Tax=Fonsecaea erecta TaxID=1367422 RepID=A0A178Z7B6_9EURO|nr:serine/threonine-protein kinase Chk2 [Fonsecaea erecta]OAP55669.1 serine/threonine-protein kinase Chk2 [Fonsecaea erecta]